MAPAVNGCNGRSVFEDEKSISLILELVPPTPKKITALHSLAVLKASIGGEKYGVKEVLCSPTSKNLFYLEHYYGFFFRIQYDPNSTMIRSNLMLQGHSDEQTWIATDEFRREDYLFEKNLSSMDCAIIETVIEANAICRAASSNPELYVGMEMIRRA